MRVVFSTDWYSDGMGYTENVLPAVLARRGHEVFVVSSTMQVYGDHDFYSSVYERFLGPPVVEAGENALNGVTVIRLPIVFWWKRFRIARRRTRTVLALRPDIVFTYDPRSYQTIIFAMRSLTSRFRLFSAVHTVASIYPAYYTYGDMSIWRRIYLRLTDTLPGWLATRRVRTCYATTPDSAEIATRFFGARKRSVKVLPQGIDTCHFRPLNGSGTDDERRRLRARLNVAPEELLCIYTGRLTQTKNPQCLASAIALLRANGRPFRALFLGEGEQEDLIRAVEGCIVEPFVPYPDLPGYYRAADIGVWPRQESISMIDGAACGLPIVASDRMKAIERIEGNGLTYSEDDPAALAAVLSRLEDGDLRRRLGAAGAQKMANNWSIELTADILIADFKKAMPH